MNIKDYHTGSYGTMYFVRDMDKAVSYYKDNFGWEAIVEGPEWTEFKISEGNRLCLHIADADQKIDGKGIMITSVKEIEKVVAELKTRGVEFNGDIQSVCEGGFSAGYRDPDGNQMSLFEYKG